MHIMKNFKYILFCLLLTSLTQQAIGFEIVYPKTQEVTINSPVTFFIGNEKPETTLKINDIDVEKHASGGFYHVVKLEEGENLFEISNGQESSIYKITRPQSKEEQPTESKIIEYETSVFMAVCCDNVPLRSTPVDGGINRLQHFNKGIIFEVIGEYNDFYKVKLARDDYGYIKKEHLAKSESCDNSPANIVSYTYSEDSSKRIFNIKLDKKVPYVLSETRAYNLKRKEYEPFNNGLDLVVYNIANRYENKYLLHINADGKSFGYKSYYTPSNELIIEVKKDPGEKRYHALKGMKITLDPGHGGSEYGAIGCLGDKEKDINLSIAQNLKKILEKAGAEVFMTRTDDSEVSLSERVKFSQENNTDIFISIHNNALPDELAESNRSGTSTYYYYPQSYELAKNIRETMVKQLKFEDDKTRQESFAVVRNPESLSILIEAGYMIVPKDNAKLRDKEFQKKVAAAIFYGLEKYFDAKK